MKNLRIAVLIPCYNESATIMQVIQDFQLALPHATIYVYDNGSTDESASLAKKAGAKVSHVAKRGKGHVMCRMFADIDADIYVMVDGDATYDPAWAPIAIQQLHSHHLDMVVCIRKPCQEKSFRLGHQFGNKWFTRTVNFLFNDQLHDIFSGYRVFSRRFIKSFPALAERFEIEAEMTIHALQLNLPMQEIPAPYQERPVGSHSKLNTLSDGLRILRTILLLFVALRPLAIFGNLFFILLACALLLGGPIILHFLQTGLVPRLPTALLAASLGLLAALSLACGIVLNSISRARLESKKLFYLQQ